MKIYEVDRTSFHSSWKPCKCRFNSGWKQHTHFDHLFRRFVPTSVVGSHDVVADLWTGPSSSLQSSLRWCSGPGAQSRERGAETSRDARSYREERDRHLHWPGSACRWAASNGIPALTAGWERTLTGSPGRPASCSAEGGAVWRPGARPADQHCREQRNALHSHVPSQKEDSGVSRRGWKVTVVLEVASLHDGQRPWGGILRR